MTDLKEGLLSKVDALLAEKSDRELVQLLAHQDFHVLAHIIDTLPNGKRKVFMRLPPEKQAEVSMVLSEDSKKRILPRLSDEVIARFLHFCAEDDSTDILQHLSEERRASILHWMKDDKRRKIEKLLTFGSETAGGLMDLNFIEVRPTMSFRDAQDCVRKHMEAKRDMPTVLVVDEQCKLHGHVPERTLLFPPPHASVADHLHSIGTISHRMDRENVMQTMGRMRSEVLAVTDDRSRVLGVVHLRDLMKVAQAEATEDVYGFAGVDVEEHPMDAALSKVRHRANWLILNLFTAFMAAMVVALFEGTIARFAVLAVYMPIVAGMGGNAATQALAVTVRGIAIGEISWMMARRVVIRESIAGMLNGCINGIVAAAAAVVLGESFILGVILMVAMVSNLFVAGFFGALIPFILKRLKIDPAIASSIFVTTTTDICGFFVFLGLGALFMR